MDGRKLTALASISTVAILLMTMVPTTSAALATPVVIFEEGADEAVFADWNSHWQKFDANTASSLDCWCRVMQKSHTGSYGAWCSKSGYNSHYLTKSSTQPKDGDITGVGSIASAVLRYDTNMDSLMRRYVSGMSQYTNLTLTFWFYSDTGVSDAKQPGTGISVGYDFLNVVYYTGTNNSLTKNILWTDTKAQAVSKTWTKVTLTVPNTFKWIGFEFVSGTMAPQGGDASTAFSANSVRVVPSGSTGMREGVFLDDISLTGIDVTAPSLKIISPGSGAVVQGSSATITWKASDPSGIAFCTVKLDSGSPVKVSSTNNYTFTGVSAGAHTVTLQAVDVVGNARAAAVKFTVQT